LAGNKRRQCPHQHYLPDLEIDIPNPANSDEEEDGYEDDYGEGHKSAVNHSMVI